MKSTHSISAPSVRAPIAIATIIAAAGLAAHASAADRSWLAGYGFWSSAASWTPLGIPGPADIARLGNIAGVENDTVTANQNVAVAGLVVTSGMEFRNQGFDTTVGGSTFVGTGSLIHITEAPGGDLLTTSLTLSGADSRVYVDDARIRATQSMSIGTGSVLDLRDGDVRISDGGTFVNNGRILARTGVNFLIAEGDGLLDLDGTTGNGEVDLSGVGAYPALTLYGAGLTDAFNGRISLGPYARLAMNLDDGWEAAAGSVIEVYSGAFDTEARAQIGLGSGPFLLNGHIDMTSGGPSSLSILSNTTVGATATADIEQGGLLRFSGATAPTKVAGGTFHTYSDSLADGLVAFTIATNWRGTVTFDGAAQVDGQSSVSAPSVINANRFDMDGSSNDTAWNITHPLIVNAEHIAVGSNTFRGSMEIGGGFLGKLTVNLASPGASWTMGGELNLVGDANLFITRIAGSFMTVTGDVSLPSGKAQIESTTFINPGASINLGSPGATLRTRGHTYINPGVEFSGNGTLQNGPDGVMVLHDGVALNQVGLVNESELWIGFGDSIAAVDRFTNTASGTLIMDVFGNDSGMFHDLLLVSGGEANLDGTLQISLIGSQGAEYLPQVGDEFTILVALGGVTGMFASVPTSYFFGGYELEWSVIYNPNTVVIRLENIVPTPGALALFGLGGLLVTRRVRQK